MLFLFLSFNSTELEHPAKHKQLIVHAEVRFRWKANRAHDPSLQSAHPFSNTYIFIE